MKADRQVLLNTLDHVAVACPIEEYVERVAELAEELAERCNFMVYFDATCIFQDYKSETCVNFLKGTYCRRGWYEQHGYKIISVVELQNIIDMLEGKEIKPKDMEQKNTPSIFPEPSESPIKTDDNILAHANDIVNNRSEEKERQYGPFSACMIKAAAIYNLMSPKEEQITTRGMYRAMVAMKLAREAYSHKQDNLLDACAYLGAMDNFINEQAELLKTKGGTDNA